MKPNPHRANIVKAVLNLGQKYSKWNVFSDFVEISALAIVNSMDKSKFDEREARYIDIMGKYNADEQKQLQRMYVDLTNALHHEVERSNTPVDILGIIFHELELHNNYAGQFFTPQEVCDMMGKIALHENEEQLKTRGFISMAEPCIGSGAMCFGFASAMVSADMNYCTQLVIEGTDIDIKCVHMAYVQLSLYGIPAVVIHGNSITLQEWSRWYTPMFVLGDWHWRLRMLDLISTVCDLTARKEEIPDVEIPETTGNITVGKDKTTMTRRIVAFTDPKTGKTYKTPEFNGDKTEYETLMGGKSADGCTADWDEIFKVFDGVTTLAQFKAASKRAQGYYHSFLGDEVLPIEEYTVAGINITNDSMGKAIELHY